MSSGVVVVQKPLAERIYDRVKDQLGDMVTDDDLKPLVDRAMKDAFFNERGYTDQYGRRQDVKEPYLVMMVRMQMEARVQAAVDDWFKIHPEVAAKAIEDVIAKGVLSTVMNRVEWHMSQPLNDLVNSLRGLGVRV